MQPQAQLDPKRAVLRGLSYDAGGMFTFAAQVVEVEVDELTGRVDVIEAWSAHDVGRAINPAAVEGQIESAVVQGLGYALHEELRWQDGHITNTSMSGYKVPGAPEAPGAIHPLVLEIPAADGPLGAKGVAEIGLVGVAPAVCNAIRHATGARITRLPATAERALHALLQDEL